MKKSCARCGAAITAGKHIYSKYTKSYYCWDLDECEKRAAKRKKELMTYDQIKETADKMREEIEKHGFA
jgi:hypothetical protein